MTDRSEGKGSRPPAQPRSGTFTGSVWGEAVLPATDGVRISNVYFAPGSRTYWHRHEHGQAIHVISGDGWVVSRSTGAVRVRQGDTVWAPPGDEHWHGADAEGFLVHLAVSIGETDWLEEAGPETLTDLG